MIRLTRRLSIRRLGTLVAAVTLVGAGLIATTGAAAVAHTTPIFDLDGVYRDIGDHRIRMSADGDVITVDLSPFGRPNGTGLVTSPRTIVVNFPDDRTYVGTLIDPHHIRWSNDTVWSKVAQLQNVVGMPFDVAVQAMRRDGFAVQQGAGVIDCRNLGMVAQQSPGAFAVVAPGSTVVLQIGVRPAPPRSCQ